MRARNQSCHQRFQRCKLRIQQHASLKLNSSRNAPPTTQPPRTLIFRQHPPPPVRSPELACKPHHKRQLPVQDFFRRGRVLFTFRCLPAMPEDAYLTSSQNHISATSQRLIHHSSSTDSYRARASSFLLSHTGERDTSRALISTPICIPCSTPCFRQVSGCVIVRRPLLNKTSQIIHTLQAESLLSTMECPP